ncbi:ParB/RepB/Spo0J family partition protein [Variovorax sp. J2P1-59]|uniref:ParB/RepB/Spo0J family partition protein n=1 Tax=Variovorax flavidus TaxID=3053501 RepID=UPI002576A091|nr:ParB/RepB/Spo0J family partition protein [Variovorax sp. J2P1-59]MDM0078706.1 ParB/RepB/Spo0J family partition protein [Variovorax sp. J2P1-59]
MSVIDVMDCEDVVVIDGVEVFVSKGADEIIPLNQLFLSARNVRKKRDPSSIRKLAAAIRAHGGLLHGLCVVRAKRKGFKGEVIAGGRRLEALLLLAAEGSISKDWGVPCKVFAADHATSVSLAENDTQEPMHAADQLEAFKLMLEEGRSVGQIAAAFGVTALTVERRLKLAKLAPMFIDLFREDQINLDVMQALALADDHETQIATWEALPSYSRSAYYISQMLTAKEVRAGAPVARFVGLDAYQAAGGAVRADLFATEDEGSFLQDPALLHRLALLKLEAAADELRAAGWKWVEARVVFPYADRSKFAQLHCEAGEPTDAEAKAMEAQKSAYNRVTERLHELESIGDEEDRLLTDDEDAELDTLCEQQEQLHDQLNAMQAALCVWVPEQRASAGVVVFIGSGGQGVDSVEGLVRPEDRKELVAAAHAQAGTSAPSFESAPKERAEFTATLCTDLTAHRTAAVAAALTQSPKVALVALLHSLLGREREPWQSSPVGVRFDDNAHGVAKAKEYDETPAAQTLEQAEGWADHLPGDTASLFGALSAMDEKGLLDLLARCVARSYSVIADRPVREARGFDVAQAIESALDLNMADWWKPTPERFLNHVSNAKRIEALSEACGAEAARPIEKMKKVDAVAYAAAKLEGTGWLPSTLRPYAVPVVAGSGEEGDTNEGRED